MLVRNPTGQSAGTYASVIIVADGLPTLTASQRGSLIVFQTGVGANSIGLPADSAVGDYFDIAYAGDLVAGANLALIPTGGALIRHDTGSGAIDEPQWNMTAASLSRVLKVAANLWLLSGDKAWATGGGA